MPEAIHAPSESEGHCRRWRQPESRQRAGVKKRSARDPGVKGGECPNILRFDLPCRGGKQKRGKRRQSAPNGGGECDEPPGKWLQRREADAQAASSNISNSGDSW